MFFKTELIEICCCNKYISSAPKCLNTVTIGQHHIYQDVSCIETPYGDDCTAPLLNEYTDDFITSETSNIAPVRLERKVSYSDFVRPICLPLGDSQKPEAGEVVVTSGWGEEENTEGKNVKIKKRIKHTVMKKEECENGNPILNPICGLRLQKSTSYVCAGDNGGPLMYRSTTKNQNWIALGIVTRTVSCTKHEPVVAERLTTEILDWIIDNIKA